MPQRRKQELINCRYFSWLVAPREKGGVYYADGRSNKINAGRHSLGTKIRNEAIEVLRDLDLRAAVREGLADAALLAAHADLLDLDRGIKLYMDHVQRPRIMRGASKTTAKRYRAVFDKFKAYAANQGVCYWQEVSRRVLEGYGRWLDDEEYAYRSKYLELTTLKQAINWLVTEKHLPESCRFAMPLTKAMGTDVYCYRDCEVAAMITHCASNSALTWLGDVIVGLAYTGLRISEAAQLRWGAVDLENNMLLVIDNSRSIPEGGEISVTSTKTHSSRSLPIHQELRKVLERVPRHKDGRVFHGSRGGALKPDVVRTALIRDVLQPLGKQLPKRPGERNLGDGRVHSFRHYFCSKCARDRIPEQTVSRWLGHRGPAMTRHYYHLYDDQAQDEMKKFRSVGSSAA